VPSKSRNSASRIRVTRETHDTPAAIAERIARAGGTNRYGEPNFRVVWGGTRLTWIGGRWTDRDAHGNTTREAIELRRVPKYLPVDRWHIERWMPPEFYGSPEEWRRADVGNRRRHPHPGARPVPRARRLRALLHIAKRRRRIRAAHRSSVRLHRPRHRMVAPPTALRSARCARATRSASRTRSRRHRRRGPRRRLPVAQAILPVPTQKRALAQ
jgi:hypothetical protein